MTDTSKFDEYIDFVAEDNFRQIKERLDEFGYYNQLIGGVHPKGTGYADALRLTLRHFYPFLDIAGFDVYVIDTKVVSSVKKRMTVDRNAIIVDEDEENAPIVGRWASENPEKYEWNGVLYVTVKPFGIYTLPELVQKYPRTTPSENGKTAPAEALKMVYVSNV